MFARLYANSAGAPFLHKFAQTLQSPDSGRYRFVTMSFSEYNQDHCQIIESGMKSIDSYYRSNGDDGKRSILLCLDRYLDPYYQYDLPYQAEVFKWLISEFWIESDVEIKQEIFELVENYSSIEIPGYEINDDGYLVSLTSQ